MLVFFALGNAKVLSFALADAKVPNASSFAFWWNIGFSNISGPLILWVVKTGELCMEVTKTAHESPTIYLGATFGPGGLGGGEGAM